MNTEGWRITAETAAIRGRGWVRLLAQLAGIALIIVAAANILGLELWTGYRSLVDARVAVGDPRTIVHVADVAAIGVGAAVAKFV